MNIKDFVAKNFTFCLPEGYSKTREPILTAIPNRSNSCLYCVYDFVDS